jgi:ribosomal-protein-alanine N-acetyltransferase
MSALPRLVTERLLLRPFVEDDASAVERLAGLKVVADTTMNIPHPYPAGAAAGWIATHAADWESGMRLTLAVCEAGTPAELIGAASLAITAAHAGGEIGYWIAPAMWGRGYATEAARALLMLGFGELKLHRIQARHFTRNPASGRVMQKAGMRLEGVHRAIFRRNGRFEDVAIYAILEQEWRTISAAPTRAR